MHQFRCLGILLLLLIAADIEAQPIVKDAKTVNRQRLYKNLTSSINRNLSLPLSDSTEQSWMDAFDAMELIRFQAPWVETQLRTAFQQFNLRSVEFQRALLELVYAMYPAGFLKEAELVINTAGSDKVFAMSAEYLQRAGSPVLRKDIAARVQMKQLTDKDNPILQQLNERFNGQQQARPAIADLLTHRFFDTATVVFSFQRPNRNFPGLAIVRDKSGQFITDEKGVLLAVPQLARSINNLPGYLTNGNTPQGIFRMLGVDTSRSIFIGPTPNLQLCMPFEASLQHFMNDSLIPDSTWTEAWYKKILPVSWSGYAPIFGSYYAGKAGRTEIIAHGTTVNPDFYIGQSYYPFTPTLGCLCTKEMWSGADGSRMYSDQQVLVNAVLKAGGANGYVVVVELDDLQRPVAPEDLLPLIEQTHLK